MWFGRCTRKRVLFLSSALVREPTEAASDFFTILATQLTKRLTAHYDVVIKIPLVERDGTHDQDALLMQAIDDLACYAAIIIAPIDTVRLFHPLIRLMVLDRTYPVLTVDKSLWHLEGDFYRHGSHEFKAPPSVVVNGEEGGKLAAGKLLDYLALHRSPGAAPGKRIFDVLRGLEGSKERVEGFEARCQEKGITMRPSEELGFDRRSARKYVADLFRDKGYPPSEAFFCCNDEMAIGTREACVAYEKGAYTGGRPLIVGFDSIGEMRSLLKEPDPWILGTVDAQLDGQVDAVCDMLQRIIRNPKLMDSLTGTDRYQRLSPTFHARAEVKEASV